MFSADNDRILVTNQNGEVTFDTGTPMPHIVSEVTGSVTHTFENPPQSVQESAERRSDLDKCVEGGGVNDSYMLSYEPTQYIGYTEVYSSRKTSTYVIGTVDSGYNPDFLIVRATANRTKQGSHKDLENFPSVVPQGYEVQANGALFLETVYDFNGNSWLSRAVNVYLNGSSVVAEFMHSNGYYESAKKTEEKVCEYPYPTVADFSDDQRMYIWPSTSIPDTINLKPDLDDMVSTWNVSFRVMIGKFTQ